MITCSKPVISKLESSLCLAAKAIPVLTGFYHSVTVLFISNTIAAQGCFGQFCLLPSVPEGLQQDAWADANACNIPMQQSNWKISNGGLVNVILRLVSKVFFQILDPACTLEYGVPCTKPGVVSLSTLGLLALKLLYRWDVKLHKWNSFFYIIVKKPRALKLSLAIPAVNHSFALDLNKSLSGVSCLEWASPRKAG